MVALNYARDVRIGDKPARAVALGDRFVWPPLPDRLFVRGQSLVYDFVGQKYAARLPDNTIDYTTNVNDLGIVTRASTGTYWGPSGTLLEAAVDEARIQHDPVTGEPLGLLVESEATNNYARTTDPNWLQCDPVEFIQHDRFIDAYKVTAPVDERSGAHRFAWNDSTLFPSDGTIFSFSITVKRLTDNIREVWLGQRGSSYFPGALNRSIFSFEDEMFTEESSNAEPGIVEDLGDGYFRITRIGSFGYGGIGIAFTNESGATSFENDALRELIIADIQVSPATYPTSYIPTTDSPVTRAADNAVIDLSDVFNPDEGTLRITAQVPEGGVVASLGDRHVISDSDEPKSYDLNYILHSENPVAQLGEGIFNKVEYFPIIQEETVWDLVRTLYGNGEQGAMYIPEPKVLGEQVLYQDAAGTIPVVSDGDPVGLMLDLSGNGNHATQPVSAERPIYRTDGVRHWLEADGVDDTMLTLEVVPWLTSGTAHAFFAGKYRREVNHTGYYVHADGNERQESRQSFSVLTAQSGTDRLNIGDQGSGTRSISTVMNSDRSFYVQFDRAEATGVVRWDSGADEQAITTGNSSSSYPIRFYSRGPNEVNFGGRDYGIIAVGRPLSPSEREVVRQYMGGL